MKTKNQYIVDRSKSQRGSHDLSKQPGGAAAVQIVYKSGDVMTYRNVHYPKAYMKRIWEGDDALNIHDVFVVDGKGKRIDDE
tara:strand:+ start:4183 stop:4428 length:246 start_codon:yes stop_codon:yes gene_type:complete